MNLRRISLLTLLLTFHILLAQQVHSVRTFGLSNGLSSSMTFDIFKDKYGFIWTSTRLGIDCFDGQNFKHFSLNKNDMRMADDGVRHDLLYIDGTIYVFSDLGEIGQYCDDTDTFDEIYNVKPLLGGHSLHDLYVGPDKLILGLYNGLCILDRKDLSVLSEPCKGVNVHCIIPFAEQSFLVGSNQGLWCLDLTHNTCERMACEQLDYLSRTLSVGYNVSKASCVSEAKIFLKSHSADLIISDVMMPGMRGDEWCEELKSNFETSHIPVILLTAIADKDQRLHGLSVGADDYVTKPFDINILLIKIRNIFEAQKRLHAYYMQNVGAIGTSGATSKAAPDAAKKEGQPAIEPQSQTQRSMDDQFIAQLMAAIEKHLANPDLAADDIASEMAMSHTLFYEKVRKLLGVPPANLLRNCRMRKAKVLLLEGGHSINEIALMCGFSDPKYFSTVFKKYYGCPPSKIEE